MPSGGKAMPDNMPHDQMPGDQMSGMEMYDELTRTNPAVAECIVFITGGAFTPLTNAFLDRVPNERLEKPLDSRAVRTLVEKRASSSKA